MTENEKIELFDKWYDENYDEWAEGEEGIALREELEQAFKSGIATLEKENAELKADNDARKFAMAMSEKVEKQLREENAELKKEWQEQVQKATDEGYARTLQTIQLTNAKELLKNILAISVHDKRQCTYDAYILTVKEAEQFLKDSEVEK